jgi:hypothetical protein
MEMNVDNLLLFFYFSLLFFLLRSTSTHLSSLSSFMLHFHINPVLHSSCFCCSTAAAGAIIVINMYTLHRATAARTVKTLVVVDGCKVGGVRVKEKGRV